jgi:hypothetical protein
MQEIPDDGYDESKMGNNNNNSGANTSVNN